MGETLRDTALRLESAVTTYKLKLYTIYLVCAQSLEIVRGRGNPGGRQQGYRGGGVRVLFSNPSYTLTLT